MKERPIIMQADSIRAILAGMKTQTRRQNGLNDINNHPEVWERFTLGPLQYMAKASAQGKPGVTFTSKPGAIEPRTISICPVVSRYGQCGDRLWVKESYLSRRSGTLYRADYDETEAVGLAGMYSPVGHWKHSMFMPRKLSRITLELADVRVERVQDISEKDAIAEGFPRKEMPNAAPIGQYRQAWNRINGKDAWDKNPWVWVIAFRRIV